MTPYGDYWFVVANWIVLAYLIYDTMTRPMTKQTLTINGIVALLVLVVLYQHGQFGTERFTMLVPQTDAYDQAGYEACVRQKVKALEQNPPPFEQYNDGIKRASIECAGCGVDD